MNLKKLFSKYTLQDWIFIVFSFLWVGIIMMDYLNKQVIYISSIRYFKYFNLFTFYGLLGAILSASYINMGPFKKVRSVPINGITILIVFLLAVCTITLSYNKYWQAPLDYTNYLHLIGKGTYTLGCTFLMLVAVYSIGNKLRTQLIRQVEPYMTFVLLDICLGFVLYTFILMILGTFGLLQKYVILGIIAISILINHVKSFEFIKSTLWNRIKRPKDLGFWGALIAFFILIYITMNYFYTQAPFPLGFDARNYYVNISKLISEAGALIPGFQPYAWGLVMSTGYVAFNSPEITLFISALGGILSLFAIYHFCNQYLKISSNYSFLVVLLFLLTPTVTNHFIIEFKVDLALVFFQLVIITFLLWWIFESDISSKKRQSLLENRSDYYALAIIGVLLGYCLSIKVLSVFLIFGIFVGFWWYHDDIIGVIALSAMAIGLIITSGFDSLSGLREYHLSPGITGMVLILIGFLGFGVSFYKSRIFFQNSLKTIIICGLFSSLTFSPWIYKNYHFTKSTSLTKLLMGEKPKPTLELKKLEKEIKKNKKKAKN